MNQIKRDLTAWHVLLATWLGVFFDALDATIYTIVLFPALSELLGTASHSQVGIFGSYILALFMLGWAAGAAIFGVLGDYIGRVKTMIITIIIYAVATALCATSHNWAELAFYRFLVGVGIGGEVGVGAVLLAECWRGRARLYATGVMCSAFGFGYLATALLNLGLGQFGWRWMFLVGIVPAFLTIYIRAKLKEPPEYAFLQEIKRRARLKQQSERSEAEEKSLRFSLPDLFSTENRHKTLIVAAMGSSAIMGFWAVLSWVPAWINQLTGTAAIQERSITMIVLNIGFIAATLLGGAYVQQLGKALCFRLASLAAFLCCVGMFLTVKSFGLALLTWSFFIGFFTEVPFVIIIMYLPELFETRLRATGFGVTYNIGRIFAAIAALCAGQLISFFAGSYALAGAWVASVYLIGFFASFFMPATTGEVKLASQEARHQVLAESVTID